MKIPRLSTVEKEILDLLRNNAEMYGLEMVKASSALKRGTIYVTLDRMTEKGLVKSRQEKEPSEPGMPRRLYQITGQGAAMLRAVDSFEAEMAAGSWA